MRIFFPDSSWFLKLFSSGALDNRSASWPLCRGRYVKGPKSWVRLLYDLTNECSYFDVYKFDLRVGHWTLGNIKCNWPYTTSYICIVVILYLSSMICISRTTCRQSIYFLTHLPTLEPMISYLFCTLILINRVSHDKYVDGRAWPYLYYYRSPVRRNLSTKSVRFFA